MPRRAFILVAALGLMGTTTAIAQTTLPTDVQQTCPVSGGEFASWFVGGKPTDNGLVWPADSVNFDDATVCNFYKWSAQMFLWITSPQGAGTVLTSPSFFTISPEVAGKREFIPNDPSKPLRFAVRVNKQQDIGEVAQAGSAGVLLSQFPGKPNSLVYYGIHSNDVYAYFRTGIVKKNPEILTLTNYPNTAEDLVKVQAYATGFNGTTFNDPQALVMELKTSWVDVNSVADRSQFITVSAEVPSYTPNADNTVWTLNTNTEVKELAMVGVHIVATVKDHPELVWATFEHLSNTPAANYSYTATDNTTKTVDFDSSGNWIFIASGASDQKTNVECARQDSTTGNNLVLVQTNGVNNCPQIEASNTIQEYPWGSPSGPAAASITNNTLLLSTNTTVLPQLNALGDIRANYMQIGGIWTSGGVIPQESGYNSSLLRGSLGLVNSTMETYVGGSHCFTCHQTDGLKGNGFGLSHVFDDIDALPQN